MVSILITAGPTREYLDDVRFLSNGSSGRMGCALAAAAAAKGHHVVLVLGPVAIEPPSGIDVRAVVSAQEMLAAAESAFASCDVAIAAAAVADHRPAVRAPGKPPRGRDRVVLELVPNPDIAAALGARKGARVVVGFALESKRAGLDAAIARGEQKLAEKQLDLVVVNLDEALGAASSQVVLCYADGRREDLPRQEKAATAARIVDASVELWQSRRRAS